MPITRFGAALVDYGLERACANDTTLWIGLDGRGELGNAAPLHAPPAARQRVVFLEAPVQADLIAAFVASPEAERVEDLFIGTAQDYPGRWPRETFPGYDMAAAVGALRSATLPALRQLTLGDMEDRAGGFRLFGTVGEISHVFAAAPQLAYLGLHGNFALATPVRHGTIDTIETLFDTYGVTGETITQETLDNLLLSDFPSLSRMLLEMSEGGDEADRTLPDGFLAPGHMPALRMLEIDRLTPAAGAELSRLKALRRLP